jgi:fatty acid desaturase
MLAVIVGAIAFTAITRSSLVIRIWVLPLLLVAEPVHFWVELPEHFGCDLTTMNVLLNTRTIRGSWLSFWFTNGNNFHVEHHLYPRIAIDKLPRVHATLRDDLQFFDRSYWSFLRMVLSREPPVSRDGASAAPQPPALPPSQARGRPPAAASTAVQPSSRAREPT